MRLLAVIFAFIVEVTLAKATYNIGPTYHGPPAPLSKDGKVVDTPEVAHAKAAHFAAYHHIASKLPSEPDEWTDAYKDEVDEVASNEIGHGDGHHGHYEHHDHHEHHDHFPVYHGPPAPLGHDGRVVDTDEVARAKAAHLAALEHAKALAAKSGDHHDYHHHHQEHHHEHEESALVKSFHHVPFSYHGPPAPLAHDGRVIDTPEVAKARDAHLHALAHAKSLFHHP